MRSAQNKKCVPPQPDSVSVIRELRTMGALRERSKPSQRVQRRHGCEGGTGLPQATIV